MSAKFVWYDETGEGLNRYGLFRRVLTLGGQPTGTLHLFADQRYRLLVNGQVIGHGPARFKLVAPEYDTFDLAPWLREGRNVIAVMVCAYGIKTFITDESVGALIAWGEVNDATGARQDLATPSGWRARRSDGHRETDRKMTFAVGLPEVIDARVTPADWAAPEFADETWPAAVPLANQTRWGALRSRTIPMLDERIIQPQSFLGVWRLGTTPPLSDDPFGDGWHERAVKLPGTATLPLSGMSGERLSLVFDFGTEVLGRAVIELAAPAGTVVDVFYTEQLNAAGRPIHGVQGTQMAERHICREGRQKWQAMHPRGFRYLEIMLRGCLDRVSIHGVAVSRAAYPVEEIGQFRCSDPVLNEIWQLCRRTQQVCMEDAFVDCPWRERGLYTGDLLIQYLTNLAIFGDHALMRRCLHLFFLTQNDTGLLAPCSHALQPPRHPDYSAIAVQALWVYWARSGDTGFVRELAPRLRRLMDGLRALQTAGTHLVDGRDMQPYLDLAYFDRTGTSCALNCFMQRAFHDAARLMGQIGEPQLEATYCAEARAIAEAIRRGFWDAGREAFVDRLKTDVPETEPSVPANTLPLLYDIATPEQTGGALAYVRVAAAHNARLTAPVENRHFNITSYFASYVISMLCSRGHGAEAEQFIRSNWSIYLNANAATCWEYFVHGWSLCHAWSTAPVRFCAEQALGIKFPEPGNPDVIRIAPQPGTLQWAEGVYPHPRGPIRISWRFQNGQLRTEQQVPAGITVT